MLSRLETAVFRRVGKSRRSSDPIYDLFLREAEKTPRRTSPGVEIHAAGEPAPQFQFYTAVPAEEEWTGVAELVGSLLGQTYGRWSWTACVAPSVRQIPSDMDLLLAGDPRLRVLPSWDGSLPPREASDPVGPADYLGLLSANSVVAPHALRRFAEAVLHAAPDLVYADEDNLDEIGRRGSPFFKPDWSPALLLSEDFLTGLSVVRWELAERQRVSFRKGKPRSAREVRLRLAAGAGVVTHVPEILCHLRTPSLVADPQRLERAWADESEAIRIHAVGMGVRNPEVALGFGGFATVRCRPSRTRTVSVVIPNRDQAQVLNRCLASLAERTRHPIREVLIVDTGSQEAATRDVYRRWARDLPLSVLDRPGRFNFGATCNLGAASAHGDLLLFLNNDTEALDADWLDRMVQWFDVERVGIVGAKLLFPDGRIQHAGVIVGMGGIASHLFYGEPEFGMGPFGSDHWYRDLSAVTGACLLTARPSFEAVAGFDEAFIINYQDIDFCLRIRDRGERVIYTPDARLIHHEGLSHGKRVPRSDFERALRLWQARGWLNGDPFYNPNLSYSNPVPEYRFSRDDNPARLARRLARRLPRKEILQLPDDLR